MPLHSNTHGANPLPHVHVSLSRGRANDAQRSTCTGDGDSDELPGRRAVGDGQGHGDVTPITGSGVVSRALFVMSVYVSG